MRGHLTVKQLIKELKQLPQDAVVVWRDHDNDGDDFNDFVRGAYDYTDELGDHERLSDAVNIVALQG